MKHFFADIIPIVLPLALIAHYYEPVHILLFNVFLISVLLIDMMEHSGFDFAQPLLLKQHDTHYEKYNVHYRSLFFIDWLHGTDELWEMVAVDEESRGMRQKIMRNFRQRNLFFEEIWRLCSARNIPGWEWKIFTSSMSFEVAKLKHEVFHLSVSPILTHLLKSWFLLLASVGLCLFPFKLKDTATMG